ncbi:hypothetical protein [Cupriavidus basilensis]|uniref:hypothetical protein n=1 Tax=Cupriavidus basilensis TaxID=68895 RepID=UPI00157AD1A2|nr:hypothetical protein [Cupriavidus basilensis]NUA26085.1 hypothetical protein [Cupriavidus basilensis]
MNLEMHFTSRHRDPPLIADPRMLKSFAASVGLDAVAQDRHSSLLVFQMIVHAEAFGIDPSCIADEIKVLEGIGPATQTKPATAFTPTGRLAGLHHKHFTSSTISMVAGNILAANGKKTMARLAADELSVGITEQSLGRFVDRLVMDGYDRRATAGGLTGEWIVFVEHGGKNYYLCLATHRGGDDEVLQYIRNVCHLEFPFLKTKLPNLFAEPPS